MQQSRHIVGLFAGCALANSSRRLCSSHARELLPQLASLADTRGVVRLSGHGLIDFLQVSYDDHNLLSQVLICWLSAEKPRLTFDVCLWMQGLLTNDVKQLVAREAPAQYAAILNSHGRHLHDLFLYRQPGSESTVRSAKLCRVLTCQVLTIVSTCCRRRSCSSSRCGQARLE